MLKRKSRFYYITLSLSLLWLLMIGCEAENRLPDALVDYNTDSQDISTSEATPTETDTGPKDDGLPDYSTTEPTTANGSGCQAMDILFVIDDSGSMMQEQENLAANFPRFIQVLDEYESGSEESLSYRVAVTTTSVTRRYKSKTLGFVIPGNQTSGIDGQMLGIDSCGFEEPWLDGPEDSISQDFGCAAVVGTGGSATEMPFAAIEDALGKQSEPGKPNTEFYRKSENSLLVVVLITDEDDCSIENQGTMVTSIMGSSDCAEKTSTGLYTPERTKAFLDDLTGGPGRYVFVAIAGPKQCSSDFGDAVHARRIERLVDSCGDYGVFGNICEGDLWSSLEEALDVMEITCNDLTPVI